MPMSNDSSNFVSDYQESTQLAVHTGDIGALINDLHVHKELTADYMLETYGICLQEYPYNSYGMLKHGTSSALYRVTDRLSKVLDAPIRKLVARSKEQQYLMNALMDQTVQMVTVRGLAGTGKTYCVLAAAMEQALLSKTYKRIVLCRPRKQVTDGDEAIGALPGDVHEKLWPQMLNFRSNLENLMGRSPDYLETIIKNGDIEIVPLEYMRGLDLKDCFVVCDEAQNLGPNQYATLVTRIGENSKIVIMGDERQTDIDSDDEACFVTYAKKKAYENSDMTAMIELTKVERSRLVALMNEILYS